MKIKIKIHSFIDVITNSSSEIFVRADERSIETLKDVINALLNLTESKYVVDDIFNFEIEWSGAADYRYDKIYDEIKGKYSDINVWDKLSMNERYEQQTIRYREYEKELVKPKWWNGFEGQSGLYGDIYISVSVKEEFEDSIYADKCAKMLSGLHNLFSTEEVYC